MAIHRHFIGWDQPCLPQCADWLLAAHRSADHPLDLATATLVVPVARAGRRLLELLVERSQGQALTPPAIVTTHQLPERLYNAADDPLAGDLTAWLLRAQAIEHADDSLLAALMPRRPARGDLMGHLGLARQLHEVAELLGNHRLTFQDVADHARQQLADLTECDRWAALARLDDAYRALLASHGLADRPMARRQALARQALAHDGVVVLLATIDLPAMTLAMLDALASPVHALVHAPSALADGFDHAGRLRIASWMDRPCPLRDERIHLADRPIDQAYHVAKLIGSMAPAPRPDAVSVGLGDASLGPMVERVLAQAGIPVRLATGRTISQSQPVMALDQLAGLLSRRTTQELAQALRCPAVESAIRRELHAPDLPLLSHLDQYVQDHLPHTLDGQWLGDEADPARITVAQAHRTLMAMLPDDWGTPRPLANWRPAIGELLQRLFGHRPLDRFNAIDARLIRAIQAIASALDEQARVPADLPLTQAVTLPQAMQLLLMQLAGQLLPPEAGDAAVELLGWLELQLDDAPHLVITGFNEGHIPQSVNQHWLLPDTLCERLGLPTNAARQALETYRLTATLHSRPDVHLIAGRVTQTGDPLAPSRLLLASEQDRLPMWIRRFYEPDRRDPAQATPRAPLLIGHRRDSLFRIPRPQPLDEPITSLRVTAFRDYLACPYRFYLRHVLRLQAMDDQVVELDALAFGNLAHAVLEDFAHTDLARCDDPAKLEAELRLLLGRTVERQYGRHPAPAVRIQQETLAQRLGALARWQAHQVAQGWALQPTFIEHRLEATLDVDGEPFHIHGRIDRCDLHPTLGSRLLDYKTSEQGRPPDKTHRKQGQWIDLQLPLYHTLAQPLGLPGPLALGYVQLPRDLGKAGLAMADWSDDLLHDAMDQARQVIRLIRQEVFWPPTSTPRADEFAGLCMDGCLDRQTGLSPLPGDVQEALP